MTWTEQFLWWAWLPYLAHIWVYHFLDGLQNTTRNIARIYLIKNYGVDYNKCLVVPIQTAMIPDSMWLIFLLWGVVHTGSFTVLLFFQGWGTALVAEFVLIIFGGFIIPINYQPHLKRVYKYLQSFGLIETLTFQIKIKEFENKHKGVLLIEKLIELLCQAISEQRNPQNWWGVVLRDAYKEKLDNLEKE